jgi:hypothetical protein
MSYNKKDYRDFSEISGIRDRDGNENTTNGNTSQQPVLSERYPADFTIDIMVSLQQCAEKDGVEIFNNCDHRDFVKFINRFRKDAYSYSS